MDYDLIIIGSGPGGYVAAIRASQLKMKWQLLNGPKSEESVLTGDAYPQNHYLRVPRFLNI